MSNLQSIGDVIITSSSHDWGIIYEMKVGSRYISVFQDAKDGNLRCLRCECYPQAPKICRHILAVKAFISSADYHVHIDRDTIIHFAETALVIQQYLLQRLKDNHVMHHPLIKEGMRHSELLLDILSQLVTLSMVGSPTTQVLDNTSPLCYDTGTS